MAVFSGPGNRSTAGGVEVGIFLDKRDLKNITAELKAMPEKLQQAEYQAVKRTTKSGKSDISKKLREEINLKKKLVDDRIKTKMPSKGQDPTGRIIIGNRGYSLINYGGLPKTPPTQQGVPVSRRTPRGGPSWKVLKKGPRVRGRNHFIARSKKGTVHIMVRTPGGRGGANATAPDDYRIKYGPGLITAAQQAGIDNKLTVDLTETLRKNLLSQVDRMLQRSKKDR